MNALSEKQKRLGPIYLNIVFFLPEITPLINCFLDFMHLDFIEQ